MQFKFYVNNDDFKCYILYLSSSYETQAIFKSFTNDAEEAILNDAHMIHFLNSNIISFEKRKAKLYIEFSAPLMALKQFNMNLFYQIVSKLTHPCVWNNIIGYDQELKMTYSLPVNSNRNKNFE